MLKDASVELYKKKILYNFPMIFRPIVRDVIETAKPFLIENDYRDYLRALIVGEPTNIEKISHSSFNKSIFRIRKEYRNDFFYLVAKTKEFTNTHGKFLMFLKAIDNKEIMFR